MNKQVSNICMDNHDSDDSIIIGEWPQVQIKLVESDFTSIIGFLSRH